MQRRLIPIIIILALLKHSQQIQLQSSSFCIGNCIQCPQNPYQCSFIESLTSPNSNNNCLPYSVGSKCQDTGYGYQAVKQNGLTGWTIVDPANATAAVDAPRDTCTIYHQDATVPKLEIVGLMLGGQTITKIVPISQDTLESIVLKLSFTFQSSNKFTNSSTSTPVTPTAPDQPAPPTNDEQPTINPDGSVDPQTGSGQVGVNNTNKISNRTDRAFVDIRVTGPNINYLIQANYPTMPARADSIVNSSCGVHMQYIHTYYFNQSLATGNQNLKIDVISIGGADSKWGLAKMEVLLGCGGLMVPSGQVKCAACMSGYYPIIAQNKLSGCAPCLHKCKTCTPDRCTLCQQYSFLSPQSNKCELSPTYAQIPKYTILQGTNITDLQRQNYFSSVIASDSTNTAVSLQLQLYSVSPYAVKFFIIYDQNFVNRLNGRAVNVVNGQNLLRSIRADQFRTQVGMYDRRFPNPSSKLYVKNIYINRLSIQNINKIIQISVQAPQGSSMFYISNYQLIQYQCSPRCTLCDRQTNTCQQCQGFFITRGQQSCLTCANGFYIFRNYTENSTSIQTKSDDTCIKCHSTCKQCIGSQLDQCTVCFNLFYLDSVVYDKNCIKCMYDRKMKPSGNGGIGGGCARCQDRFNWEVIFSNGQCTACVGENRAFEDVVVGESCQACWVQNGLAYGRCIPTPASGLSFYGGDISNGIVDRRSWTTNSTSEFQTKNCSSLYPQLFGIATIPSLTNQTIRYSQKNLPPHLGLYIIFNIFKLDLQPQSIQKRQSIYIRIINGALNETVDLINRRNGTILLPGSNICEKEGNQMIQTYSYDAPKHNGSVFQFQVSAEGGGLYLRQLEVYLGECSLCASNRLNYEVKYLPRYSYNNTVSSGLDVWIIFNKPINVSTSTNLENAFKFSVDELPQLKLQNIEFQNQLALNNRLRYYIPIDSSFQNGTLRIRASPDARIFGLNSNTLQTSRRLLVNSPLNVLQSQFLIRRFSKLSQDNLVSTNQIYWFYNFFQWFALITMIVCAFFGIGVIFEEFSILLQLLFLHVYISSSVLPATYKAPVVGLERMENLNYFIDPHAQNIERSWFGNYEHPSPYVFQQYNKDILFQRSFYPTIIINLIYLGWFIIMLVLYRFLPCFKSSSSPCIAFFRNIPARPLNYIDQIWRYQFITTMWSAFMQFHILKNDTAWQRLNLALCFISFIISIIWPFFVVCYTYRLNSIKYSSDFLYKYQDIYYKKIQTISEGKIKYYYYVFIRFARYFIMVLFICVFTQHQIIAPVILICVNVIELIYVVWMKIYYNSVMGTVFKVAENLLFIGVQVALLFVYGLSDTANQKDFLNLGHALNVLYVIMIILGLLRVAYLLYQKIRHFGFNMKLGADNGEVVNVGPTPLPNTDRGDLPNNNIYK